MKIYFIFLLCLSLNLKAYACRGLMFETQTFLKNLPKNAMKKDVVAEIKILSSKVKKRSFKRENKTIEIDSGVVVKAKAIKAFKGIKKDAIIKIEVEYSSCSDEPEVSVSETYFIAGSINKNGIFYGEWAKKDLHTK